MKKRVLATFLALMMALSLLPTSVLADGPEGEIPAQPTQQDQQDPQDPQEQPVLLSNEEAEIYVSADGNDGDGDGSQGAPYATLAKAAEVVCADETGKAFVIHVMDDLTANASARFFDHNVTIIGDGDTAPVITRGKMVPTQDYARGGYNPAMIEVSNGALTLKNIVMDDGEELQDTHFFQMSTDSTGVTVIGSQSISNTALAQDAMIASYDGTGTITLDSGAVLQNFRGMSAVRITGETGILTMKNGSKIIDTENISREKYTNDDTGPAGAVWVQNAKFVMEAGAVIQDLNGRAVYVDGGEAQISGTISNITGNKDMWQGFSGAALHIRSGAKLTLFANGNISDITNGNDGSAVFLCQNSRMEMKAGSVIETVQKGSMICLNASDLTMGNGAALNNHCTEAKGSTTHGILSVEPKASDDTDENRNTVIINGEITGIHGNPLQIAKTNVTIGATGNVHDNFANYGALYLQKNARADVYGKINHNQATGRGGGIGTAGHGYVVINLYDGCEIKDNSATNTGGGASLKNCKLTMSGGEISGNRGSIGGGLYLYDDATAIVNGGIISGNSDQNGSNDLAITYKQNGTESRYLYLSEDAQIGNPAVYMETNTKTVTAHTGSRDMQLHNASKASITALTKASNDKGWEEPLATFWMQRASAATLTVGGLTKVDNSLPVYVLVQETNADGTPENEAAVSAYRAELADGNVTFTIPDGYLNGCAVAIVQPSQDYGTLTISGPAAIKQNKTGADYPVTYTVTYAMSESLRSIIEQANSKPTYHLTVNADTHLNGTPGAFDGSSLEVTYTLPNSSFVAGDQLYTSAELTITVGGHRYTIPSNVAVTDLIGLRTCDVTFDWNDNSGKTTTVSVTEGGALGDQMPADPTRSGYTFTGWNTSKDGSGKTFSKDTVVESDMTVYAQWTANHVPVIPTPSKPTLNTGDHFAYVMGYPDGTVRPNGSITRAEVSTILFRLLSDKTREEYFTTESSFTDVKAGAWYNNSVATLEKAGVIVDTAKVGAFRPDEAITRAELAAMLAQFSDAKPVKGVKFSDVSADHWAYDAIAIAAKMGWIEGYPDGTFRPDATITRAEMMTLVNRTLERMPSDEDHLLSERVMLTFPDCTTRDWFYIAVQEATNSHTYERAATEKNGDEQWTALRDNRDWTKLEY